MRRNPLRCEATTQQDALLCGTVQRRDENKSSAAWCGDATVLIQRQGGFDMILRMRLRRKRSQMPCNLVNFISVTWESEVGWGWQQGEDTRKKEKKKEREGETKKESSKVEQPQRASKGVGGAGGISYHHHGFVDVQRCPVGSVSVQAWRIPWRQGRAAKQQGGEKKRPQRRMCCPFLGAFTHAQGMSAYVQSVPYELAA